MTNNLPLGLGGRLFVLNTMREAKFEDLLSQLIYDLVGNTNITTGYRRKRIAFSF